MLLITTVLLNVTLASNWLILLLNAVLSSVSNWRVLLEVCQLVLIINPSTKPSKSTSKVVLSVLVNTTVLPTNNPEDTPALRSTSTLPLLTSIWMG